MKTPLETASSQVAAARLIDWQAKFEKRYAAAIQLLRRSGITWELEQEPTYQGGRAWVYFSFGDGGARLELRHDGSLLNKQASVKSFWGTVTPPFSAEELQEWLAAQMKSWEVAKEVSKGLRSLLLGGLLIMVALWCAFFGQLEPSPLLKYTGHAAIISGLLLLGASLFVYPRGLRHLCGLRD